MSTMHCQSLTYMTSIDLEHIDLAPWKLGEGQITILSPHHQTGFLLTHFVIEIVMGPTRPRPRARYFLELVQSRSQKSIFRTWNTSNATTQMWCLRKTDENLHIRSFDAATNENNGVASKLRRLSIGGAAIGGRYFCDRNIGITAEILKVAPWKLPYWWNRMRGTRKWYFQEYPNVSSPSNWQVKPKNAKQA